MSQNGNFTLFKTSAAGGAASGDFVMDAFRDISVPASSNGSFTSNANTNPMGYFFGNDDAARDGPKTVFIKDLKLVEDRSKWIDNKTTYEIIWDVECPYIKGYVAGNIRQYARNDGKVVSITSEGDIFAVCGVIRNVGFLVQPSIATTASADIVIDGVDTGSDVTMNSASSLTASTGYRKYFAFPAGSTDQTRNIHEFRLTANEFSTLELAGVVAYFDFNSSIDCFPGTTYVDKDKKTTSVGATFARPTPGPIGQNTTIYKTQSNSYGITSASIVNLITLATGTSGTNSLSVTTGHGASFSPGMGIVAFTAGGSHYVGGIEQISTDTFTVGPTLPFELVGATMFRGWASGPTLSISPTLMTKVATFDPDVSSVLGSSEGFGLAATGDYAWQSQNQKLRIWGDQLARVQSYGQLGVGFNSNPAFLHIDGFYSACEFEFGGSGIIHGTMMINGVPAWGINETFTGSAKKTIMTDAGLGWNSCVFYPGTSFGGVAITKINFYEPGPYAGITLGRLADYSDLIQVAPRTAYSATMGALGTYRRVSSESLYFSGNWVNGATTVAAGGVRFIGSSTNAVCRFRFYGTSFAIIGAPSSSLSITLDGNAIGASINYLHSATLGFHSVVLTNQSGTLIVDAIDYCRPRSEMNCLQNFQPVNGLTNIPSVYEQTATPQYRPPGTIWGADPSRGEMWIWLFNRWNRLSVTGQTDDPRGSLITIMGGDT